MFRKPKRNFRRRVVADSDSDNENDCRSRESMDVDETNIKVKDGETSFQKKKDGLIGSKKKESTKKDISATALSFDHEEEESEVFKIRKSIQSRRLAKQIRKERKEKEQKVKEDDDNDDVMETKTDENTSVSKPSNNISAVKSGKSVYNGNSTASAIPRRARHPSTSDSDTDSDHKPSMRDALQSGVIPDAKMIHMIRKKRQMVREMGGEDFIPLKENDTSKKDVASTSRLIRDDENDRSDEEEGDRMDFSVNTFARERQQIKDDFLAAEHGSDEDDSDHQREWEEQQIRKGVSTQQLLGQSSDVIGHMSGSNSPLTGSSSSSRHADVQRRLAALQTDAMGMVPSSPLTSSKESLSDVTIDVLCKRLRDRLTTMDEVRETHIRERDKLFTDIYDMDESSEKAAKDEPELEERFKFFQEMRGYVRDLVECLNEKVPYINQLESRMLTLLKDRTTKLVARRQQDVQDQCLDYTTSMKTSSGAQPEDVYRQRRAAEREARRGRRRRGREQQDFKNHHDGLSSDDEENKSDMTRLRAEQENLVLACESMFEDVEEDFYQVAWISARFENWKYTNPDSYKDAYISICLPKLFNPLVRLSLLNWNPLNEKCYDFETSLWYSSLLFYGHKDGLAPSSETDDDVKLLASIVEKIVVPKVTVLVESVWDPLSTTQTSRLVNLVYRLSSDYPTITSNSKPTQALLKAVVLRIRKSLDADVFMPLYPRQVLEKRHSDPSMFFHRQCWTCIKLLGSILSWHGIVDTETLRQLALDSLLNRYIILGLQNSDISAETMSKCQAIVSTLPKSWFSELPGEKTLPQLETFCRYIVFSANAIEKASLGKGDICRKEARDQTKQLSKILVNINAMDHALNLNFGPS